MIEWFKGIEMFWKMLIFVVLYTWLVCVVGSVLPLENFGVFLSYVVSVGAGALGSLKIMGVNF